MPIAGSTWTTGLSAPGGLVDKDRRCEALRVRFTVDGEVDVSEGGGGGRAKGRGGGGEAGGEAMILYTKKPGLINITKNNCMTYVNESSKIKCINRNLH